MGKTFICFNSHAVINTLFNVREELVKVAVALGTNAISNEKKEYLKYYISRHGSKTRELCRRLSDLDIHRKKNSGSIPGELGSPHDINNYFLQTIGILAPYKELLNFYGQNYKCNRQTNVTILLLSCSYILKYLIHLVNSVLLEGKFPHVEGQAVIYDPCRLCLLCRRSWRNYDILSYEQLAFRKKHDCNTFCDHVTTNQPLVIRDAVARYSTDVIASCAFGLETNCLTEPDAPFRHHGKKIFEDRPFKHFLEQFVNWNVLAALGFRYFPEDSTKFFLDVVNETIEYREKNNIRKNDFVHLLLQLKNTGKLVEGGDLTKTSQGTLSYEDVASSMFVFYMAGFETSSSTTSFLFYELAQHQEIQDKLRDEVREVLEKHGGKLTYEALQEMHYAQMCIDETLRLYPPAAVHFRKCTKTYQVPDSDLVINKGVLTILPTFAIQRDANLFPNPEKFNPENFTDEARAGRISTAWTPFGEGPRQCIGMRFGYMQVKTSIAALLNKYRYSLHESTPTKLTFACDTIALAPAQDILINVSRVD